MTTKMQPPKGVIAGTGAGGKVFPVLSDGFAYVDDDSVATLLAASWTKIAVMFQGLADPTNVQMEGGRIVKADPTRMPFVLAQSGVPTILPSSGSSNASGQITLTTALPYVPQGTVSLYLPAGVVVGDAVGGLKQAVFSSTTVCQLVGNPVTANGAYVQSTAAVTLASHVVRGGLMGPNGSVRTTSVWGYPNNANLKTIATTFGGAAQVGNTASASVATRQQSQYQNRGSQALQMAGSIGNAFGSTGAVNATSAVDTSADQTLAVIGQLANAADFIILEGYSIEVLPSP